MGFVKQKFKIGDTVRRTSKALQIEPFGKKHKIYDIKIQNKEEYLRFEWGIWYNFKNYELVSEEQ